MNDLSLNELINTKVLNIKSLIETYIVKNIVDGSVTKGRAQEALEECRIICGDLLEEIRKNIDNPEVYEYAGEEDYQYRYVETEYSYSFNKTVPSLCDQIIKNNIQEQRYICGGAMLNSSIITAKFEFIVIINEILLYHELD